MAVSRYNRDYTFSLNKNFATAGAVVRIRKAIESGTLRYELVTSNEAMRLDSFAASVYGDGRYWWVIAAASNIGWGLQVPPGTELKIPQIEDIMGLVS